MKDDDDDRRDDHQPAIVSAHINHINTMKKK